MAIDPRISMGVQQADVLGAAKQGQQLGYNQVSAPIELQSQLNKNEQERLNLEELRRVDEFKKYIDKNPPVLDANGRIDIGQTAKNMFSAGQGQFALGFLGDSLKINAGQAQNQNDLINTVKQTAIQLSQATKTVDPKERSAIAAKASQFIQQQFGFTPEQIFGTQDWMSIAQSAPTTELQAASERRANITSLTTKEDVDPNSKKSQDFRNYVKNMFGVDIPASVSIGGASRDPIYQKQVESFMIDQGTRVSAGGEVAGAEVTKTGLTNLYNAMSTGELTSANWWKPAEKIVNIYKSITNNEDRAKLDQILNEAKALGIEATPETTLAGVRDAIARKIGQVSELQAGKKAIVGASGVKETTKIGTTTYVGPNGKIYRLTQDDLNNPTVQQAIKDGRLRK